MDLGLGTAGFMEAPKYYHSTDKIAGRAFEGSTSQISS